RDHATRTTFAALARGGHVERIAAHAEAGQLAVDARIALLRMLVFLDHEHAGTVGQYEAVAILVPRTARLGRLIVARGQRAGRTESADRGADRRVLGAAGDHDVGVAVLDHAHRQADVVRRGRAGGHAGDVRSLQAEHDRQVARGHVDDRTGHEERGDLALAV